MRNEGDVKKAVRKIINSYSNSYHFMPPANGYGRSGIPDIVGHVNGNFFAVETKFGSNKPTANQLREIDAINAAGAECWVVSDKTLALWETTFRDWADSVNN